MRDAERHSEGVELSWSSVEGETATVLVAASRGADLLVLGAPSGTAPADRPLGSVTAACLREAIVPVVVVPARLLRRKPGGGAGQSNGCGAYCPAFTG